MWTLRFPCPHCGGRIRLESDTKPLGAHTIPCQFCGEPIPFALTLDGTDLADATETLS